MSLSAWYWLCLAIGAVGAVWDIGWRKLPNLLCAALAAAGLIAVSQVLGIAALPSSLAHAALALIAGMLLFRLGMIGGGDAKFYAAAACALPLGQAFPFLGWTSVSGLVLLLVMMATRLAMKKPAAPKGWSVPYGVAIYGGLAITLLGTA